MGTQLRQARWWLAALSGVLYVLGAATAILSWPAVATNPWSYVVSLVGLTVLYHWLFAARGYFSEADWKAVDLVWLVIAAAGLLTTTAQVRRQLAGWDSTTAAANLAGVAAGLAVVSEDRRRASCPPDSRASPVASTRTPRSGHARNTPGGGYPAYTPAPGSVCPWLTAVSALLADVPTRLPVRIVPPAPPSPGELARDDHARHIVEDILGRLHTYHKWRDAATRAEADTLPTAAESAYVLFGPALLVLALAIRGAKALAEYWKARGRPAGAGSARDASATSTAGRGTGWPGTTGQVEHSRDAPVGGAG